MKQTINFSQFCDAFVDLERNGQFSYDGKKVLFDYEEEYEDSTGEQVELDVIALCCEYDESSIDDFVATYYIDETEKEKILALCVEEQKKIIEEYIQDYSTFCGWTDNNTAVYAAF